jgi:hypothetical protein
MTSDVSPIPTLDVERSADPGQDVWTDASGRQYKVRADFWKEIRRSGIGLGSVLEIGYAGLNRKESQ